MPDIDERATHPLAMSDADKAEMASLLESEEATAADDDADTSAADDAAAEAAAGQRGEGLGKASAADGGKVAAAAASEAGAPAEPAQEPAQAGEPAGDGKVDRQQFDGVLGELRETRAELKTLKAQINAKPAALPDRDFDSEDTALSQEIAALDGKLDEGDLTDAEYRAQLRDVQSRQRALDRERARYEARAELEAQQKVASEQQQVEAQNQAQQRWESARDEWITSLGDWYKNPARRVLIEQTMAAMNAEAETAELDNQGYLSKLNSYLGEAFPDFPLNEGTAGAGKAPKASPRQVQAAAGAAAVTAGPPAIEGGVGNRGTSTAEIDIEHLPHAKPGGKASFSALSQQKQNELLGLPSD